MAVESSRYTLMNEKTFEMPYIISYLQGIFYLWYVNIAKRDLRNIFASMSFAYPISPDKMLLIFWNLWNILCFKNQLWNAQNEFKRMNCAQYARITINSRKVKIFKLRILNPHLSTTRYVTLYEKMENKCKKM